MRYFFEIAYNGTNYHGWQRQKNASSVQQVVEEALHLLLRKQITITGSGRTDTGVHCQQQYFHLDLEKPVKTRELQYRLNSFLPKDITIKSIVRVQEDAHARFSAVLRSYEYRITVKKDPFLQDLSYYYPNPLDVEAMNEAAGLLIGKHDFEAFSKVRTDVNNFVCEITEAQWVPESDLLIFRITANRFLRGMVRAITGTLLNVGKGKWEVCQVRAVIDSLDRKKAGAAAPAHGLFLTEVKYPEGIFLKE